MLTSILRSRRHGVANKVSRDKVWELSDHLAKSATLPVHYLHKRAQLVARYERQGIKQQRIANVVVF